MQVQYNANETPMKLAKIYTQVQTIWYQLGHSLDLLRVDKESKIPQQFDQESSRGTYMVTNIHQ